MVHGRKDAADVALKQRRLARGGRLLALEAVVKKSQRRRKLCRNLCRTGHLWIQIWRPYEAWLGLQERSLYKDDAPDGASRNRANAQRYPPRGRKLNLLPVVATKNDPAGSFFVAGPYFNVSGAPV